MEKGSWFRKSPQNFPLNFLSLVKPQDSLQWAEGFCVRHLSVIFSSAHLHSPQVLFAACPHLPLQAVIPCATCAVQHGK